MLTAHEERVYAEDLKKYPKLRLSLAQSGPPQINQGKKYFHTFRHFPEVRLSLREISKINPTEVDERRPKCKNIVHGDFIPRAQTAPRKTKVQATKEKCNTLSRKMDKLCNSSLNDIEDRYQVLRRGIVRTRMNRQRNELLRTQPGLKLEDHQKKLAFAYNPETDESEVRPSSTPDRNYLGRACLKLRKAGLSTLNEFSRRDDIISSGLLEVIGLTQYTKITAKDFHSLVQLNLGVKLSDMELLSLHTTAFIRS